MDSAYSRLYKKRRQPQDRPHVFKTHTQMIFYRQFPSPLLEFFPLPNSRIGLVDFQPFSEKASEGSLFKVCFFCILCFKGHACHPFKGKQVLQKHDINRCKMISSIFTHCHHYAKKFLIILIKIKRTPIKNWESFSSYKVT